MKFHFMLLAGLGLMLATASCQNEEANHPKDAPSHPLVEAARSQVGVTKRYDGSYVALKYPGGDVPMETGVCTDVKYHCESIGWAEPLYIGQHIDAVRQGCGVRFFPGAPE